MAKPTNFNRRKFLQLSSTAAAAAALGCSQNALDFPQKTANLSAVGNGFTPRNLQKKPNILIAVLDDVGFADLGCYGSDLRTKCIDELAAKGTRFNNFHVTALCSPTRACLL
ncbi:MAG: sulfatase-like hydrolase/transferase, partial [Bacteroidota bacterium]